MKMLSLCMIVKNEAANLARCLESVRALDPEIVIVDTGSTDETLEIAAFHDARCTSFDFGTPDFAAARNRSLELATGAFILVLDADETLADDASAKIRALASAGNDVGYVVERRNRRGHALAFVDYAVRLFPNRAHYRYRGRVHETIDASILDRGGRIKKSAIAIDHHLPSDEAQRQKSLRYVALLEADLSIFPEDPERLTFLAAEYHKLGRLDLATKIAETIATLRPDDADAHVNVGLYHLLHQHDRARARRDFERALVLRPDSREAREGLIAVNEPPKSRGETILATVEPPNR
jgi:glycosyltransferase involved in cell wall biosynthesis